MEAILKDLKERNLFFLDSYTTSRSLAAPIARQIGLPILRRDVFLDNVDSEPAIREKVEETAAIAYRRGYAIAIGHDHTRTLKVLTEEIPRLRQRGFEMISLSELLQYKQARN
jgi:polysaccharide deacetylase 2 family uncharacterized protein YibQ